jgi:hypothetical protein
MIKLSTFMKPYKVGDYVDIKANAAQQKGMPHKFYHGCVDPFNEGLLKLTLCPIDALVLSTTSLLVPLVCS